MDIFTITEYLNSKLKPENFKDSALNGLQVQNKGKIKKIYSAVDANLFTINKCSKDSLLIVHHGLFWGRHMAITKAHYLKISKMIQNNIALYASHLPLDAHPEIGNNAQILNKLDIDFFEYEPFGYYNGVYIGYSARLKKQISIDNIKNQINNLLGCDSFLVNFSNNNKVNKICVVSGKPGIDILQEYEKTDCDLLVTGEVDHVLYNYCEDNALSVVFAKHYATETLGVKAIAWEIAGEFSIEHDFIEHDTGL